MSIRRAFYNKNSVMGMHSVGGRELSHVGGSGGNKWNSRGAKKGQRHVDRSIYKDKYIYS